MNTLFDFSVQKLPIPYPYLQNMVIMIAMLVIALASLRKEEAAHGFLDPVETMQLKGIAILLVILGHLWIHVSLEKTAPVLGDYGVTLFLVLSGFGLTLSAARNPLSIRNFAVRRMSRVFIPYWVATVMWLSADYYFRGKAYSVGEILSTFAGLNLSSSLESIDYTRWFITLLILWYVVFALTLKLSASVRILAFFAVASGVILAGRFGIVDIGSPAQIMAFPVGCLLAKRIDYISGLLKPTRNKLIALPFAICIYAMLETIRRYLQIQPSGIAWKALSFFVTNTSPYAFSGLLAVIISMLRPYSSRFVALCGLLSYELFLLHGPILVNHNPLFRLFPPEWIFASFFLYLVFILLCSFGFHRLILNMRKLAVISNMLYKENRNTGTL